MLGKQQVTFWLFCKQRERQRNCISFPLKWITIIYHKGNCGLKGWTGNRNVIETAIEAVLYMNIVIMKYCSAAETPWPTSLWMFEHRGNHIAIFTVQAWS